ncbi:conserved Plasmodium protein, unknown function [Plasmodium gallinaceum]|uniref:Uncharacterized protein n=1 Tax=Plasmodium gallinaceum TaxID=5849 RepID=A0A1J1GSV6_PLAGA|nr:conserved Plasmodium protein, unknown function [Plasmodium gallinaceum]CRG95366.1 conserved Plasmodium protein, unknown function [Plasmodium gallinaceum]
MKLIFLLNYESFFLRRKGSLLKMGVRYKSNFNIPKLSTMKNMTIYDVRKNVELCKKKNIKTKSIWNDFLYIIILKLYNNEINDFVDLMIILKLLSRYISLDKRVLNFICEKIEHYIYKLTIRDLSLLILVLRKNNFDNEYFINLISKSILMKMNKNISYKDLALITFSLSRNTCKTEQVYTKEIFNLTILKLNNNLNNINFHSLSLFFYSYSLYFVNNFDYFNSFFYMIKNFINMLKKNLYCLNSTDLMFTFISATHIYNSFEDKFKNIKNTNYNTYDSINNRYPLLNKNLNKLTNENPQELLEDNLNNKYKQKLKNNLRNNIKIESEINNQLSLKNSSNSNLEDISEKNMLPDSSIKLREYDNKNKEILEDFIGCIKTVIVEKLKCFKIQEVINILFTSLNRNFTINNKYFNFLNKYKIRIEDYINIYIKICKYNEEENYNYILKIENTCEDERFINILVDEIIYRNDCLNLKQIILIFYLLRKSNFIFVQFEKIILKRLICIEKELNKNEIMFLYQYIFLRICLFNELKKYSLKVYEKDKMFYLCDSKESFRDNNSSNNDDNFFNNKRNNENNIYMHDDIFYLEKKRNRDKKKIYLYDNFIFSYNAYVMNDMKDSQDKINMKCFIDLKRNVKEEKGNDILLKNDKLINNEKNNELILCNSKNYNIVNNELESNKFFLKNDNYEYIYEISCFNLYLDIYKILCLKLLSFLRNERLSSSHIIDILCIYEKLNIRDYRIIRYLYNLKKEIIYIDNKYLLKIINVIVNFNLYNILIYLNIDKIIKFMNFNSLDECIEVLELISMIFSSKGGFNNFHTLSIENIINYILKNLNKLENFDKLEKIQITNAYSSLPIKFYKLFKNVKLLNILKKSQDNKFEQKDKVILSEGNVKNLNIYNVDDVNLNKIKNSFHFIKSDMNYYSNTYEYRNLSDEIYKDFLLIYKNIEAYKNINIYNFTFPLAINLLTLNDNNICYDLCELKKSDYKKKNKIIELNKKNFLIIDILYNYDFFYSLNELKENKLKTQNIHISYYSSHKNKFNKRLLNNKKYTILRLIKKRGFNYICIDAKTYIKNKKKNKENNLNKQYINNLILDLLKRKNTSRKIKEKEKIIAEKKYKILRFLLKNKSNKILDINNYKSKIKNSFYKKNKRKWKKYIIENEPLSNYKVEKIKGEKKSTSNHLTKLKNMFQLM